MKKLSIILAASALSGCTSVPVPYLLGSNSTALVHDVAVVLPEEMPTQADDLRLLADRQERTLQSLIDDGAMRHHPGDVTLVKTNLLEARSLIEGEEIMAARICLVEVSERVHALRSTFYLRPTDGEL